MPKTFIGKAIRYPQPEAPLMDPQEPVAGMVTEVVVDLPGWQSVKPRIPDTLQRRRLEAQRSVREIVFGAQDGILTTLGIITGVGVAEGARSAVFISGFLAMLAGALSMAVGEYLGGKSEREVVQATIEMEKAEMATDPQGEFAEQVAYYKMKGFSSEEAQMIVRRLAQHPDIYLYEMMRDEFGIDPRVAEDTDLRAPIAMGGSFAVGSLIPIAAYIVPLSMTGSTILALVLAILGLFGVGYYAARNTDRNPVSKGLEIVACGVVVFVLSYLAGHYIPPLFGHAPVAVGG
jgi:VIT1/CCC1 family predicted Fe2+/Mn2+ transporter